MCALKNEIKEWKKIIRINAKPRLNLVLDMLCQTKDMTHKLTYHHTQTVKITETNYK